MSDNNYEIEIDFNDEGLGGSEEPAAASDNNSEKSKKDKNSRSKKQKSKKQRGNSGNEEVEPEVIPDKVLYILTDNLYSGIVEYARSCGLNIAGAFDNVEELKNLMLMQFNDMRIAVVDTGTGKFITPTIRKSIVDMIGLTDENTKFTVFYTDSLLKSDSSTELGKRAKEIEWVKYIGSPALIANLLTKKENYISDGARRQSQEQSNKDDILSYKGMSTPGIELERLNLPSINPFNIGRQVVDTSDESIRRFKLRI